MDKGNGPAPLQRHVIKNLLDRLSTDDAFRDLFQRDAHSALVEAGYEAPAGTEPTAALSGGGCMQLAAGDTLASKEQIARDRAKLESTLSLVQRFEATAQFKAR